MSEALMAVEPKSSFTHSELVVRAGKWLRGSYKCYAVVLEGGYGGGREIPDAIGFGRRSVLVECKVSRSDFLADAKKPFRQDDCGMGNERWYMAPAGLIGVEEVPEGWGLVEVKSQKCYKRLYPAIRKLSPEALLHERRLLVGLLSAVQEPDGDVMGYHAHTFAPENLGRAHNSWITQERARWVEKWAHAHTSAREMSGNLQWAVRKLEELVPEYDPDGMHAYLMHKARRSIRRWSGQ